MFSYQMKLISLHPVGPASPFDLSLLHTHQPVPLPGDGGLQDITRQRETEWKKHDASGKDLLLLLKQSILILVCRIQ